MTWENNWVRSCFVDEEDAETTTLKAAMGGSTLRALHFMATTFQFEWFPHRRYPLEIDNGTPAFGKTTWHWGARLGGRPIRKNRA